MSFKISKKKKNPFRAFNEDRMGTNSTKLHYEFNILEKQGKARQEKTKPGL